MNTRNFSMILGVIFVVVGICGFIPGLNQMHEHNTGGGVDLTVTGPGTGHLLGLFHVNVLHNAVHLLFGVMGILMSRDLGTARLYCRIVAIAYGLLAIMGILPQPFRNTFGLVPIEGNDVWLHALIALACAYFGFIAPAVNSSDMSTEDTNSAGTAR